MRGKLKYINGTPALVMITMLALLVVTAAVLTRLSSAESDGVGAALNVMQTSTDTHGGIRIGLDQSRFSGTATLVRLRADLNAESLGGVAKVQGLTLVISEGSDFIVPGDHQDFYVRPGVPGVLRLSPLRGPAPSAVLEIGSVKVHGDAGQVELVEGPWTLPLTVPGDYASFMAVHNLTSQGSLQIGDSAVSVISAVSSNTETTVTVEVVRPASGQLPIPVGQPTITTKEGDVLVGRQVEEREGGRVRTYEFPPTSVNASLHLSFPAFAVGESELSLEEVDLGKALSRSSDQARIPLQVGEVSATDGRAPRTKSVGLGIGTDRESKVVVLELQANFGGKGSFGLTFADGTTVAPMTVIDAMSRDSTGTIGTGTTTLRFKYDSTDQIGGRVVVSFGGAVTLHRPHGQSIAIGR